LRRNKKNCLKFLKFKEINCINGEKENSEKLCLVLDCYLRHEYDIKHYFTNLQHYIIKQKSLNEREALALLYKIFKIIEIIHKVCFLVVVV
jgi:hypothetical protein